MIFHDSRDLNPTNPFEYRDGRGEDWRDEALCAQMDPELFYPDQGGNNAAAKRICAACPARAACLEWAIENYEAGIWGGTSDKERRAIRASRRAQRGAA